MRTVDPAARAPVETTRVEADPVQGAHAGATPVAERPEAVTVPTGDATTGGATTGGATTVEMALLLAAVTIGATVVAPPVVVPSATASSAAAPAWRPRRRAGRNPGSPTVSRARSWTVRCTSSCGR